MSDEGNALLALKNAWTGAVTVSEHAAAIGATLQGIRPDAPVAEWHLDELHRAALAQANAVMAVRGLVEELRRQHGLVPAES